MPDESHPLRRRFEVWPSTGLACGCPQRLKAPALPAGFGLLGNRFHARFNSRLCFKASPGVSQLTFPLIAGFSPSGNAENKAHAGLVIFTLGSLLSSPLEKVLGG